MIKIAKHIKLIGVLTLFIFTTFYFVSVLTIHLHTLPNGKHVIHSHLTQHDGAEKNSREKNSHSHTENEYLNFSSFSLDKIKISFISFVLLFIALLFAIKSTNNLQITHTRRISSITLRAPPQI